MTSKDSRNSRRPKRAARRGGSESQRLNAASRRLDRRINVRLLEAEEARPSPPRVKREPAWHAAAATGEVSREPLSPADRIGRWLKHTRADGVLTRYNLWGAETHWALLSHSQSHVLSQLVDAEGKPTPVSWLATRAKRSERQVHRILAQLQDLCREGDLQPICSSGQGYYLRPSVRDA